MKKYLSYLYNSILSTLKTMKYYNENNSLDSNAANLIRLTHSIEKGLSIENPRLGFGHKKQIEMLDLIKKLEIVDSEYYREVLKMSLSALNTYVNYHLKMNYTDEMIQTISIFLDDRKEYINDSFGGTIELIKNDVSFNVKEIEDFFYKRHSIRVFSHSKVDTNTLVKAIKLAQTCPSACNRQGVRVHIIDKNDADFLVKQLSGIGGFQEEIDKFLLITGKVSTYRLSETNQYIVSASMFASYLSLTLHLYGLGSCIIQRPVIYSKFWKECQERYKINYDEQIVCMIGVGNLVDHFSVPVSHRFSSEIFDFKK